jgi:hypothetical protein
MSGADSAWRRRCWWRVGGNVNHESSSRFGLSPIVPPSTGSPSIVRGRDALTPASRTRATSQMRRLQARLDSLGHVDPE